MTRLRPRFCFHLAILLSSHLQPAYASSVSYLDGIPTIPFIPSDASQGNGAFSFYKVQKIIVDQQYAKATDQDGSTLIPPSLIQFANTFEGDIESIFNRTLEIAVATEPEDGQIFLTVDRNHDGFIDAAGRFTSEGYHLELNASGAFITGASPLGVWWGTRTLIQQALLNDSTSIPWGRVTDSPGWATRGMMLDVGRHFYPSDFLIEMCAYMSFFKQNTLHLHLSDNLWNNPRYTKDEFMDLYARFRLWVDDDDDDADKVRGLNRFANESYTRENSFEIQTRCAARGVTVLPEIEAPGHALVFTQWKPQLAYGRDMSLLNISHPETIPTIKTVWGVFLKWFHCKVVSIGADEYQGPSSDYYRFVNALAGFIGEHSGKQVRTWGMFPPSRQGPVGPPGSARRPIFQNISIQHWEFFEDDAYNDYIRNNYSVVNSNDDFYVVNKYGGEDGYPNKINVSRTVGSDGTGFWRPYRFDPHNETRNPPADNPYVLGAIAALWNDPGPNATVYSEAYYAWREGIPALADKQCGGNLTEAAFSKVFSKLQPRVPGQNLERRIPSSGTVVFNYTFDKITSLDTISLMKPLSPGATRVVDTSPNGYHADTDCPILPGSSTDPGYINITPTCSLTTPLSSKGRNYTLSLSLRVTSVDDPTNTTLLTGRDSALMLTPTLTLFASGNYYRLPPSNISFQDWVDVRIIGRGSQTFAEMTPSSTKISLKQEFQAEIGLHGDGMKSVEIAIEAPLHTLGGGSGHAGSGWTGQVRGFSLLSE